MKRDGFSLRRTSICKKLPVDLKQKARGLSQVCHVIHLRQRQNILLGQIGNEDETFIYFDMPSNYTVPERGSKEVSFYFKWNPLNLVKYKPLSYRFILIYGYPLNLLDMRNCASP